MPRIHRVRLSNIRYAYDKKIIPDLLIETGDSNLLFVLANGGGKSLILQLILQCVIPNAKVGTRRVSDLLINVRSFTGHVLVEWLLDGDTPNYLLTGFCFTSSDTGNFNHFNYTHIYEEPNPFDIASLPLLTEEAESKQRIPLNYRELRQLLLKSSGHQVRIFDQHHTYIEELKRFHIHNEEWENIRITNSEEGGITKFFAGSKTTVQLIDRILIPAIELSLYQKEEERTILTASFKRHRQDLLEIPILRKNINDYGRINELAHPLINSVYNCEQSRQRLVETEAKLIGLYQLLLDLYQELKEELEQIEIERNEISKRIKDSQWRVESHQYFVKRLELNSLLERLDHANAKRVETERELHAAYEHEQRLQAIQIHRKLTDSEREVHRLSVLIDSREKEEPELQALLLTALNHLSYTWTEFNTHINERLNSRLLALRAEQEAIRELERHLADLSTQEKELHHKIGEIKGWFKNFNSLRKEFVEQFSQVEVDQPSIALARIEERAESLNKEREEVYISIGKLKEREEDLRSAVQSIAKSIAERSMQKRALENRLEEYEQEQDEILGLLALKKIVTVPDIWLHIGTVTGRLGQLQDDKHKEMVRMAALMENIEAKLSYVQNQDFLVPHPILLQIRAHLNAVGIPVILGTEWLHAQDFDDNQKESIAKKSPLLPFSLIAEESNMKVIERELSGFHEWDGDFPIIFIARNELNLSPNGLESQNSFRATGTYIFKIEDLPAAWNAPAFFEWRKRLVHRKEEIGVAYNKIREEHEDLFRLNNRVDNFCKRFPQQDIKELRSNLTIFTNSLEELSLLERRTNVELKELELNIKRADQHRIEIERNIEITNRDREHIERYMRSFNEMEQYQLEEEQTEHRLNTLIQEQKIEAITLEEKNQKIQELRDHIRDLEAERTNLNEIKRKYLTNRDYIPVATDKDLYTVIAEVEALQQNLNSSLSDLSELKKSLSREQQRLSEYRENIDRILHEWPAITLDFIRSSTHDVTRLEIEEQRERVAHWRRRFEEDQKEVGQLQQALRKVEGALEHISATLESKYNRGTYEEFTTHNHEIELQEIKNELNRQIDLSKRVEDGLQEKNRLLTDTTKGRDWIKDKSKDIPLVQSNYNWTNEEMETIRIDPISVTQNLLDMRSEESKKLEADKRKTYDSFNAFLKTLHDLNNDRLFDFIRETKNILGSEHDPNNQNQDGKLFDYEYVSQIFNRIANGIEALKEQSELRLQQLEFDRHEIVDRFFRRAQSLYKDLIDLTRNAKINLYGRDFQLLQLDLLPLEEETSFQHMSAYLERLVKGVKELEDNGAKEEQRDEYIDNGLRSYILLDQVSSLDRARLKIFKPRQQTTVEEMGSDYARWEDVEKWSGGEKFSAYMFVYLAMTSFLRQRATGSRKAWRVLLADNPFGAASSRHILDPVFEMANSNRIQLICFTDHRSEEILKRFGAIYSLKLVSHFGKEHMRSERLESGFYRKDSKEAFNFSREISSIPT
jgi:chromosome segregation ATPase